MPHEEDDMSRLKMEEKMRMSCSSPSCSIPCNNDQGENPALEASVVKDLGAVFEQELPNIAHRLMGLEPDSKGTDFQRYLAILTQISPSFSLRGGTREILRGIIARGLGLR